MIKPGDIVMLDGVAGAIEKHVVEEHGIGIVVSREPWDNPKVSVLWSGPKAFRPITTEHVHYLVRVTT